MVSAPGATWFILIFVGLFMVCVTALAAVPAYLLWRMTKDKRYPIMWVTCSMLIVMLSAGQVYMQRPEVPAPTPINETLTDVADASGALQVTAIRLPEPHQPFTRIEIDVENSGSGEMFLGLQYKVDSGSVGNSLPESKSGTHIWTVAPSYKGTLSENIELPTFGYGGKITIVFARCTSAASADPSWLPKDSSAIYQNQFMLVPPPEGPPPSG
ncbi:MAG: hypothetical protein SGI88_19930 [Candidatus Hydrogenedentes bacterium]|nr:hypothetical protein [Candidatus Hydrogenedentota bacterium]